MNGSVEVRHADGTVATLNKGDPVHEGDTLLTKAGGAVGVVFNDGTSMSLGENGKLVLDKMAYDPDSKTGEGHLTLQSGAFALVSGKIAKASPDALSLKTPTMTVGVRGTGLAGNANTVAMMQEKGDVTGEVFITTNSGQSLTLNGPGQAASLSASGALTPMTMSALQVMQVAGNAGAALPNAANLLSAAFNQAAQAVQQQLQQQQQQTPPPPPVPPPTTGQQGPSGAEQMRAVQEAMAQETSRQVQGLKQILVNLAKEAGEKAVATALTTFHELVNGTEAEDAAAAERAKNDFAQVLADHASVLDHVNKALAATGDTYTATYELALAKTALDQLVVDAAKVTADGSGHGAEALAWVTALTTANAKSSVTPVTDANSKYGDAQAFVTGLNDSNATAWSDGSLITTRGLKDTDLATDTALLPGLKAAAEAAITNAHQALLNIETPLINAAAAEAAFVVQGGGLMDVLSNYFNAAKASITSIPTGWTADLAYTALTNGATTGLTADQIQLVTDLKAAISQANGVTGNPLVDIWRDAVSDIQDAYATAKSTYDTASSALTNARQAYQNAQDASVIAAGHYADKQSDVATDAGLDGTAIGAERAGEAAWQAKLEAAAAAALTSVNSALTSATAAAGRAEADANSALAHAATNSFNFSAAQSAKLQADAEVTAALSAQTSAGNAVTSALAVLHSLGIGADGASWSGTDANVSLGLPSNFSSALSSNQSAVTAARQSALGVYQQAVSVKAQVDQQVAVAQQEDAIAIQAMTQAQALQLQVDLQNAQTVSAAKSNATTADTNAHTSAKSAVDAAAAAAASRDAIKVVLDALNAATPPSNVTGDALATYNATKAALIATVQGYYTTAAAAADAAVSASTVAGADVTTADVAKANADAVDVNAVDTATVNLAKGYSATAASAAADASTQASTANAKASAAAAQLALATNAKAALTLAASDASAAQLRADDVAAALAAKTDVHAIINSATSATSGSLVDLKTTIQGKYDALLVKLGGTNSTDLGTLYGMWNAAKAAKDAASADAATTAAAQAAFTAANTAFNAIDGALTLALGYKGDLSGILSGLSTQVTSAQTALSAVDTAYAAALAAQAAKTSTSTALAQAIQADQAAQKALSQVSASNDAATTKAASFDQQLQAAKDNIATALNNAAKADDLVAAADAAAAQTFATAAATAAADARTHSTDSNSTVRAQTQNDLSTATSRMGDAGGKFDDVIVQVGEGLSLAGSSVLSTPAAVLTALGTVKADAVAYQAALHTYATTSNAANLTSVTNALAKLNTDLSAAQAAINTANANTNAVGVAATEVFRAEQAVVTAGNAYLQAIGSKNDAAAAWTLAQTYNPTTQITYWKSVYDAALQTVLDAKTAAANALATGVAAQAKAAAAAADLTNYLNNVLPGLPHTANDPAGKALTAGTVAAGKALTVLGSNADAATANTVYGQKLAADNAYTAATAIAFNFTTALSSGDVTGAAAAAQAALAQATNASNASTLVQQLTTLVSQTSNTAVAQDNTVHNLGVQWSTPTVLADSVFTQAGATVIDVLANDKRGGDNSGLSGLGGYTLTAGTASHGTVSVVTVGGHQQIQYTATAGYTGKDSFSYTVSYTDATTHTTVSANTSVSLVVEGAGITVPSSLSILENASATFSLAVSDGNANETVSGVVISGAPSGTILKVGTTIISASGNNFALTAGQAASGVITVIPPVDYSGQIVLTVTATATHNLAADPGAIISVDTSKQLTLTVAPVTQGPTITVPAKVSGLQNTAFDLALNVADTHLGETISAISISGFQAGSSLTVGSVTLTPNASGVITLTAAQAANATLSVHMPTNWFGDRTLLITATAQNGTAAAVTVNQAVSVHVDVTALTAQQALLVSVGSGNTRVADTAANIIAAGVANLQAHGINTFDITDSGTLPVTAVQALTLTFTKSGGGHVQVVDTVANINASGIASLVGHGVNEFALSNSGTVSLASGSGVATLTGSSGSDTYLAAATSSGTMTIIDTGGTNVLDGSKVTDQGLKGARQVGNDLVIDLNGNAGGGHLVIKNQFAGTGAGIDHIYTGSTNNPNVHVVGFTGGGSLSAAGATLTGTTGEDIILGNLGEATLIGGGGEDTFFVGGGNQAIYGDSTATSYGIVGGKVSFTYNSGPVTASLGNGTGFASITEGTSTWTDTLYNITELEGSALADNLTGRTSGWSALEGGAGNDILTGSNSASVIASYKHAGAGVTVNLGGSTYSGAAAGTAVERYYVNGTLTTGTDTLINIHGVRGSSFADVIKGGDTGFYDLTGGGGADLLVAGSAATSFHVGIADNATVTGGAGSDSITFEDFTSGLLNNTVALAHVTGVETLRLSGGSLSQSVVFDSYSSAAGITRVDASATSGGVTFTGGSGNDAFVGGSGADRAIFHGSAAGYRISQSNGTITVQDINTQDGNDGTDILSGVESLVFSDRTLAVGVTGTGSITLGTASQVNAIDDGDQSAPFIIRLADGGYIISWTSPSQGGNALSVVAQRYNAAGNEVGTEFVVEEIFTGDQWDGQFVQLLDGKLVAIWHDNTADGNDFGVVGRIFPADYVGGYTGNGTVSPQFIVNSITDGFQAWPVITPTANGGFFVAWDDGGSNGARQITGQFFDSAGGKVNNGEVTVGTAAIDPVCGATTLSNGSVVVMWRATDEVGSDGVFARIIDSSGGMGGLIQLNSLTPGTQNSGNVVALANGGFAAIWHSDPGLPNTYDVYCRVFSPTGVPLNTPETLVNTTTTGWQAYPAITALPDGGFLAVWDNGASGNHQVFAQRFSDTGQVVGSEFAVSAAAVTNEVHPSVTTLANGDVEVTWLQPGSSGTDVFREVLHLGYGNSVLTATAGADTLDVGGGFATINAGDGNDIIKMSVSTLLQASTVVGGAGTDQVILSGSGSLSAATLAKLGGIENLVLGGSGSLALSLAEGGGLVTIDASATSGTMSLDASQVGSGVTLAAGTGATNMIGGNGHDVVSLQMAEGSGTIFGSGNGLFISGTTSLYAASVEELRFSDGKTLTVGGNGDLRVLSGGSGDDVITVGSGFASVVGGLGNDTISVAMGSGGMTLDGGAGADTLIGGMYNDTFRLSDFSSADSVSGGMGTDTLSLTFTGGGVVADAAFAHVAGVEVLSLAASGSPVSVTMGSLALGAGITTLDAHLSDAAVTLDARADAAVQTLIGGTGADTLIAGAGGDTLTGNAGGDVFTFASGTISTSAAPAVISDFVSGTDHIDLSAAGSLTYVQNLPWLGTPSATAALLDGLGQNAVGFMTDGIDGWLAVRGSSLDGTLIKLAGVVTAPTQSDISGAYIQPQAPTVAGFAERSAVLFANGTSKAATINLPGDVFGDNQISVEFDVNLGNANLVQTLFSLGSGTNALLKATVDATGHLGLYVNQDGTGNFSSSPGVATITSSSWHHVAVSYDSGTARIYLDGSLSATVSDTSGGTSCLSSLNTMAIASELSDGSFARGMFDNVKVWNSTLSVSQIGSALNLTSETGDNLIGNWTFDSHHGDGAGNDTNYDAYMNLTGGHVGTPPMRAAHFNASHNVSLGNAPALAVTGGGAFTYGAWVKTSSTALSTLFSVGDNISGNGIILYITPDGTLQLDGAQQGGAAASIEVVNDGMWHHVAVSYDGAGTATYYVDGVAAGASSGYTNLHTSGNVSSLGIRADGNEPFIGDMGDATIWSRALGASDIKEMMTHGLIGHEYGLTGYWSLDEGTGTIAYSQTGAVNGSYDAGTTWTSSNHADLVASVQQAQAFTFDGTKYLSAGDILDPGAHDFTLEAWVKPTTLTGDQMIIAKDAPGSTQPVISLFLHNGVPTLHLTGADGVGYVLQAGSVTVNQWSHIAVTRGGDQYTLYVDGVAVKSVSALDADISNSYNLTIGARSDAAGTGYDAATAFHGQIADVRVWSVERSAADIFDETVSSDACDEGLRASWVGTGLTDLSGNGHTLSLPSGVTNVVQSTGDLPVYSDGLSIPRDGQYHGALLAHDAGGAAISYSTGTAPVHGTLVLNADGSFVYKPNSGYEGLDSFTLTATANGLSSSRTVALRVEDPTEIVGATQHMGQLLLDGSNHAVVANAGQMTWLGGGDFTMEAWIDPTAAAIAANEAVILSKQFGQGASTVQLRLLLNHGQLAFMASDGTDDGLWTGSAYALESPTALTAGNWAHVAVTRSGDVFTLYVNGEAVSSIINPFTNSLSSNADLWVGQSQVSGAGANGFDGAISDVRLWGYGRSASDIGSNYNQVLDGGESGLIGYWNGLGGLQDLSGNGHQLILPSDNPPVMAMVPETATHFGGGSHISIGTGVGQGSGPLTYEAWVRTSYGSAAQTIFSTDSATAGQGLSISVGADGKIHVDAVNSAGSAISTSVLNDGLWHHVAVTLAPGGTYIIYVDGTPEVAGTVGTFSLSGPLNIGSTAAGTLGFHGDIAEARIWNAALSGLQVNHAMNSEQTGAEAGLAGYWRLDEAPVGSVVQDSTAANHDGTVVGSAVTIVHNDAPIYDDVLSAMAGSPYHGTLDAIAPTSAGGNVTWALGTAPTHGTLVVNADGTFTYTPASGWHGIDSFNVVATGSDGNTTTKLLSVNTQSPVEFMGSGAAGGSLQFGGDNYAVANAVNLTNKSFSWEFWANKAAQATPTAQTLLSEGSGGVGQNLFVGFDAAGHLRFSLDGSSGGTAVTCNAAADAGAWHHWAGTYDATTNTLTLYRDGVAVQSVVTSWDYTNTNTNLYVGGTPAAGGSYVGQLDQVRLFDDVRTPTEIWNNWHRTESVSTDHLIAEWSMDRISSTSTSTTGMVLDSSGHNANLVLASTVADMVGNHGLAMGTGTSLSTLDGHAVLAVGSQGLVAANASTLATGTGAFTYSAWVSAASSGRQDIVGIGDVGGMYSSAQFLIQNGSLCFEGVGLTSITGTALPDTGWHQVAMTYDTTSHGGQGYISFYIDGLAAGGGYTTDFMTPATHVNLNLPTTGTSTAMVGGNLFTPAQPFSGHLSEVAVWNTSLDGTQLQGVMSQGAAAVSASNLLADWTMSAVEKAVYVNTSGKVSDFDGSSSHVHVADTSKLDFGHDFTVETWIRPDTVSADQSILSVTSQLGGNTVDLFNLEIANGQLVFFMVGDGGSNTPSAGLTLLGPAVGIGVWSHVAVTVHNDVATLYVNGQPIVSSSAFVGSRLGSISSFDIGSYGNGTTAFYDGLMSDVRVWDTARSASDINTYQGIRLSGQEDHLAGNWRLETTSAGTTPDSTGHGAGTATLTSLVGAKAALFDDVVTTREDTELRAGLFDVDHVNMTQPTWATIAQGPQHGTLSLTGTSVLGTTTLAADSVFLTGGSLSAGAGGYSYKPDANYFGSDYFVVAINDGSGNLTYGTVAIGVRSVRDEPTLSGLSNFSVAENGSHALNIQVADDVGAIGGDQFTVDMVAGHGSISLRTTGGLSFVSSTVNGSSHLIFTGTLDRINAALSGATYATQPLGTGSDAITLNVWDSSNGTSLVSSGTMNVTISGSNLAPITYEAGFVSPVADYAGGIGTGQLGAIDPESGPLTFAKTGDASHGFVTVSGSGGYTYTASAGFTGWDSFTYSATDTGNNVASGTQHVAVYEHLGIWTVGVSGAWGTAGNWSGGAVPDSKTMAAIANVTVNHASGNDAVGGLSLTGATINISGGTVVLGVAASLDGTSSLDISGGVLSMAANSVLTDMGGFHLNGGGSLSGSGSLGIYGAAVLSGTVGIGGNTVSIGNGGTITSTSLSGSGTLQAQGGGLVMMGANYIGSYLEVAAAAILCIDSSLVSGGNDLISSTLTLAHALDNLGRIEMSGGGDFGGTSLIVDGVLTNHGSMVIGGSNDADTITATSFDNYGVVGVSHALNLTVGTFDNHATLSLSGGNSLTVGDSGAMTHAHFDNHGKIGGSGGIDVVDADFVNHGYINPGDSTSAGTLNVTGGLTLANDSHVVMDFWGSSFDRLNVNGVLTLDGTLDLYTHGTINTQMSATLLTWTSQAGSFDVIHGIDSGTGWIWDPTVSGNSLSVTSHSASYVNGNGYYSGSGGTDYVVGYGSNEVVHLNGGADVYAGHGSYNTIGVSDLAFHFLDGGSGGGNTLQWENACGQSFDLSALWKNAIQNFDVLDLSHASNNNAVLDLAHLHSMLNGTNAVTGTTNALVVIGGSNVTLADSGWQATGAAELTVNGQHDSYTQYSNGDTHVYVENHTHVG
ncbi:LamG-like jellyroll fold domain-containing protein [Magnetospirillum sp. 15-1]|uniref:LamG-like jellyroll fold domain-containing protein n=1 Tax=Magnetospirillum sp. 15-1 TaxID=1979370 RepID=UPI001483A5C9|nr:LamG-like jellyroll fold domain-containing protein [Magnetospirillum sp. 15-1]